MILILSKNASEYTTELVMDWIEHLGATCFRLNGEDILNEANVALTLSDKEHELSVAVNGRKVNISDVNVIWFRRTINEIYEYVRGIENKDLENEINRHLSKEFFTFYDAVNLSFSEVKWLSEPKTTKINKIDALVRAKRAGLNIPRTLLVNNKKDLLKFMDGNKEYIVKAVGESTFFFHENDTYPLYTEKFSTQDIERLDERLFPSLVQEYVDKDFEIRTFYLNGACYSMAIFSQSDDQTRTDFRQYNYKKPNRTVPFKLPRDIEKNIKKFMNNVKLDTGSLDLIKARDGRYVLLEVNPVGQFGMVSQPCNYYLEEKVARHLVIMDQTA